MKGDRIDATCNVFDGCNLTFGLDTSMHNLVVFLIILGLATAAFFAHAVLCAVLAHKSGRSALLWFFIGFFTSISGLIFLIGLNLNRKSE